MSQLTLENYKGMLIKGRRGNWGVSRMDSTVPMKEFTTIKAARAFIDEYLRE